MASLTYYPSGQSAAPSHKYWIEMQAPSPGHLNGSYGWQGSPDSIKRVHERGNDIRRHCQFHCRRYERAPSPAESAENVGFDCLVCSPGREREALNKPFCDGD